MRKLLAAMLCAAAAQALASGDYGPSYTLFKAYRAPDIALPRFQAGELGVIQPGMRRVYLYSAWRAMMLGPKAARSPGMEGGLARADGSAFGYGWSEPDETGAAPLISRLAKALRSDGDDPEVRKIAACPATAITHAVHTLDAAAARPDATPARLDAWIIAQQQVGAACQETQDARYRFGDAKPAQLTMPPALPDSEPAYWRQVREYQRAAWYFHAQRYAESAALFERIGATRGHPMQALGRYLALRADIRRAVAAAKDTDEARREQQASELEARGARILGDAALTPLHEATRALLRAMRFGLTPDSRLAELSRHLDSPRADPFIEDRLGDWALLMDGHHPATLRGKHDFVDWIETVRECAGKDDCAAPGAHALERWRKTAARPWLVATLMLSQAIPADVERAALAIGPDYPAWVTARYQLARLARLAGRADATRTLADEALRRALSPATRNLFREERFAAATSVRDAGRFLLRTNIDYGERGVVQEDALNDDGLRWLNDRLAVADLIELAGDTALPVDLRARVAGAAWMRAALLGNAGDGKRAATLLAELVPAMAPGLARYQRAPSSDEARHAMLVESMRFGLAAQLTMYAGPVKAMAPDDVTASGWCSFRPAPDGARAFAWRLPAPPSAGDSAARQREQGGLQALKTATGTVGDDVLEWVARQPADPELPWLLHVVVASTRGGCLDGDAKQLSKKAHGVLHKRWPGNEWARKTPYFY
ncbi:hypothetical protein [Pseudoduganella flava]|nr:hypothetical protein [Pseudoduganella flava]QGZ38410.1 hypothetical protein GO485_04650 [Pseudoduganella flava]